MSLLESRFNTDRPKSFTKKKKKKKKGGVCGHNLLSPQLDGTIPSLDSRRASPALRHQKNGEAVPDALADCQVDSKTHAETK